MERPKFNDEMRKELSEIVGKIVFDWLADGTTFDQCVSDSYEVLKHNHDEDGYVLAKAFEDKGYSPDTMLVDELDCVSNEASVILKKHIQKWVLYNDLKLKIQIGSEVKYTERRGIVKIGKVVKWYPETMQYGVRTPEQSENAHYLLNSEDVTY